MKLNFERRSSVFFFTVKLLLLLGLEGWLGNLKSWLVVRVGEWDSSDSSWDEGLSSSDDSLWGGNNSGDDWLLDVLDVLDWLLDVLDALGWLLDVLDGLDWLLDLLNNLLSLDLLDWLVDDLSFNGLVLDSFLGSFLWDVLDVLVIVDLWDVLSLVFNGIVISDFLFFWDIFSGVDWLLDSFIFDFSSFVWDVLNSGFSLDWGSDLRLNNLDWLLDDLNWLLLDNLDWLLLNNLDWLLNVLDLRVLNWLLDVLDL